MAVMSDDDDGERPMTVSALSVVVPAFNEEAGIGPVLDRLVTVLGELGVTYEIIVVDDGSDDGTGARARQRDGVRVIRHPQNAGYGASVYDGVLAARYERIIITDADGTYPIEMLPELLQWAGDFDMVVGGAYRACLPGIAPQISGPAGLWCSLLIRDGYRDSRCQLGAPGDAS